MGFQRLFHRFIGAPDGTEAAGFRGHNVDAAAVVHGQIGHAGAKELHDAVFHGALGERRANQGNGHVLGTHAGPGRTGEVDGNDPGIGDIIGLVQKLLDQLRAALADGHGAVSAVPGVGIGADDHFTAAGVHLPHVAVNDRLVGRDKLAAVLLGGAETEHVVIFVDGAAHGTEAVVAVGQHIGQGKLGETRGPGRLNDAHIGDVVGSHGVEFDFEEVHGPGGVVLGQNAIGHGAGLAGIGTQTGGDAGLFGQELAIAVEMAAVVDGNHWNALLYYIVVLNDMCIISGIVAICKKNRDALQNSRGSEEIRNTGCISSVSYCTVGAKDPPRTADTMMESCRYNKDAPDNIRLLPGAK